MKAHRAGYTLGACRTEEKAKAAIKELVAKTGPYPLPVNFWTEYWLSLIHI